MALSEQVGDTVDWLDNIFSLKEAAKKLGTPSMVQVVLGCEDDDFNPGVNLKLDFGIAIRKVGAHFVSERPNSAEKHDDKNEVLIPLGYTGKVKVVLKDAGSKLFTSVTELIKEFPRFVNVEEKFTALDESTNKEISVSQGSRLELKETVGSQKLHCNFGDKTIALTTKNIIKFRLLADDTIYTLQEVVDRLHLPQTVKFQDSEFKNVALSDLSRDLKKDCITDTVVLNRITSHEVVVGILKPQAASQGGIKRKVKQILCLFPIVSSSVGRIEVKIPKQKTDKAYTTTMRRLFPQEVDRNVINKSLYFDLAKDTNIYLLKDNGWIRVKPSTKPPTPTTDVPPALPPGRQAKKLSLPTSDVKSGRRSPSPRPDSSKSACSGSSSETSKSPSPIEECPQTPPPPPRQHPSHLAQRKAKPIQAVSQLTEEEEFTSYEEPVTSPTKPQTPSSKGGEPAPQVYEPLRDSSGSDMYVDQEENIYDDLQLPMGGNHSKDKKADKKDGKRTSWNPFKKKKGSKDISSPDTETKKDPPFQGSDGDTGKDDNKNHKEKKEKKKMEKEKAENVKKEENKKEDKKFKFGTLPKSQKPVGTVTPNARGHSVASETFQFSELTVSQLADRFRLCDLHDLASLCKKEKLDGKFFSCCSEEELSKEPFNLSKIHIMKISQIKTGWTPKH